MLTMACRVRRNEVQSPTSSRSPSPVDEADIQDAHARLGRLLDLDSLIDSNTSYDNNGDNQMPSAGNAEDEEQEFEFRLFRAPSKAKDPTTSTPTQIDRNKSTKEEETSKADGTTQKLRIRLRSPTPNTDPSQGRFIRAFRGWQYYFTTPSLLGLDEKSHVKDSLAERSRQFGDMAVSGAHLTQWAKSQPWVSQDAQFLATPSYW